MIAGTSFRVFVLFRLFGSHGRWNAVQQHHKHTQQRKDSGHQLCILSDPTAHRVPPSFASNLLARFRLQVSDDPFRNRYSTYFPSGISVVAPTFCFKFPSFMIGPFIFHENSVDKVPPSANATIRRKNNLLPTRNFLLLGTNIISQILVKF